MAANTVRHIKYKNIAIALAIVLLIFLAICSACSNKGSAKKEYESSSVQDNSSVADKNKLTTNFRYISIKNEEALYKGVLTLVDAKNKYKGGTPAELEGVYSYLFNKSDDQIMSASSTDLKGAKTLLDALNSMVSDFYTKTKLSNIIINTMYYSPDTEKDEEDNAMLDSKEHETGYAFDLNTFDDATGGYPEFTGEGKYKWVLENCHKYGIIQRYTQAKADVTGSNAKLNHFRYVGKPNAEIMVKNNLCLEEYIEFIKDYTFAKPFIFESDELITYAVYYVAADNSKTTNLPIPLQENDIEYAYDYSGNNKDGYIMWVITEDNSDLLKITSNTVSKPSDDSMASSQADSSAVESSLSASSDSSR